MLLQYLQFQLRGSDDDGQEVKWNILEFPQAVENASWAHLTIISVYHSTVTPIGIQKLMFLALNETSGKFYRWDVPL